MHSSELNLKARTWLISGERTKNKRSHLVTLSPASIEVIEALLAKTDESGYLFTGQGEGPTMTVAALSRAIARNLDHFEIPKFTPHDLRRTGSTQLAAFKVPRFDRDRILNHADQSIGSVYDIYEYLDEKRAALNLWADIIQHCALSKTQTDPAELRRKLRYQDYFNA